ncbi:MAG: type II 3-dehydroquinate dehydratase [Bacteroidetes bacterium]|nr:type II 3-dehydroquinate dehydratase [Bacteroidota bacterium]
MKIAIVNGPNLNLLGTREPEVYGSQTFEAYLSELRQKYASVEFSYFQSNVEGELINKLHEFAAAHDGILLNAAAYTHTSVAIADAVAAIKCPVIEIHISNIFAREDYRHVSFVGSYCIGSVSGFGLQSYELGLQHFLMANPGK